MVNFFRRTHRAGIKLLLLGLLGAVSLPQTEIYGQISSKRAAYLEQKANEEKATKFPDQYSVLDTEGQTKATTDEFISTTLESSRQSYLQALILIKRKDTVSAARYFQQAIDILNKLVSYPNIDKNEDFTDLAQSIVEDYESYVTSLESLDDNASLFIMRDKLFQEIENIPASPGPIIDKKPEIAHVAFPNKLSDPNNMVIPLVDHDLVDRNITFLTKNRRGINFIKQSLERTGKWFPMMKRIAANEGMPEEIIYLSMIESGLNPNAVSRASAVGLWQFMRATGQDYKLNEKESYWIDERRDPEKSTLAAMRHLRDLYYEFGDWHLAMAAYNCGTGCVRRAIRRSGLTKPSYWDIMSRLPKETSNYVPQYIATTRVAMNPELYGFDLNEINFQSEYKYDLYSIEEPTNLSALAKAAGISIEELKELNPELLQDITPADRKQYFLKIPHNSLESFAANFLSLTPDEKQPFVFHIVDRNESLSVIARKYNIKTSDLVEVNNLSGYNAKIKRGDKLRIPVGGRQFDVIAANIDTNAPVSSQPTVEDSKVGQIVTHTVQRGETIYSISNRYGIRTTDLRNLNNLSFDDDNLQIGQKLIIAQNRVSNDLASSTANAKVSTVSHTVKRGETLARIADTYGVTVNDITKDNNLRSTNIKVGQKLRINATSVAASSQTTQQPKQESLSVHLVKRGETLSTIAQQYGVTENQLREWNPDDIRGTVVIAGSRIKVIDNTGSKGSSNVKPQSRSNSPVYYTIRSGDTLGSIAKRYGVSVNELKRNNRNISEKRLQIGQRIRIK